jgi:hypothetical protein
MAETSPELHMDVPVASSKETMTFTAVTDRNARESELKN